MPFHTVTGAGPTVIFLHGATVDGAGFGPVVDRLPDRRCVVVDLPGHGRSPGVFDIPTAADAIAPLVEAYGPALVVGHSLGGQVAIELSRRVPESITGLVLLGAIVDGYPRLSALHGLERWLPNRPVRMPGHHAWLAVARKLVHVPAAEAERWGAGLQRINPAAFVRALVASVSYSVGEARERYAGPVLVVVAERDYAFVKTSGEHLRRVFSGARVVVAEGCPHTWHMERPEGLVGWVR